MTHIFCKDTKKYQANRRISMLWGLLLLSSLTGIFMIKAIDRLILLKSEKNSIV